MQAQLKEMFELQDAMNSRVNVNWRSEGFEWYRAIWIECAELMDHYGWKWWKHQSPDTEQVQLELIDIWHFGLSILLEKGAPAAEILSEIETALGNNTDGDFKNKLEDFAQYTLSEKDFSVPLFIVLLKAVDMDFNDLYCGYVGKNVLNFFRQDHGYKDGSYQKVWNGMEDNEHLVELVAELDTSDTGFSDLLYKGLKSRYTQYCL